MKMCDIFEGLYRNPSFSSPFDKNCISSQGIAQAIEL
jgi:hypothetical protein